jgi:hypothetical protein
MVYAEVSAITADMSLPATESLDDLIQLSADLATKVNVACGPHEPATAANGGQEVRRPRHASSSSDISSEGRVISLKKQVKLQSRDIENIEYCRQPL